MKDREQRNRRKTPRSAWGRLADRVTSARASMFGLAVMASATLVGCWEKTPRNLLEPVSGSGDISKGMWDLLLGVNAVILAIVAAIFLYVLFRFRERPDDDGSLPEQVHGNIQMEIAWTIAPTLVVIAITIPTLQGIFALEEGPPEGEEVVTVNVIGKQWWWEYDYVDPNLEPGSAPMFTTANEMHVPVGTWVKLNVTSADVIHAFWVPRVMGKRDATPGRKYPMYFKIREAGEYIGQCAELCGESHALMGIKLVAHPKEGPNSYNTWVESQKKPAAEPVSRLEQKGQRLFIEKGCNACHNIGGWDKAQINPMARSRSTGPDLTHVGSRTTIAGMTLTNTKENLTRWIYDPLSIKGGALMATMSQGIYVEGSPERLTMDDAEALAAYLYRLK
ncbi:MAG: cytochrome c oxidase subunit II [Myxococcota bacterium]